MNWETKSLIEDVDIIKRKIDDAVTTFGWFDEDYFKYDRNHTLTNDQIKMHGLKYHEQHHYITQHIDLLSIYLKELDTVLEDIEKASSDVSLATESDNA
ncbi:type II toxin-antitoxin system toxin TscT [Staphylococcus capitis subsp. urealyticus]|uniref:type II toxin-antitoxin system toxin TscT n=1 Tax=Staphylococcus capitis TaxID=29388 RepID=UPI00345AED39